jgi:hypothetical protein
MGHRTIERHPVGRLLPPSAVASIIISPTGT